MIPFLDLVVLRWLARSSHTTASAIGAACAVMPGEVRSRLVRLESMRLVAGRQYPNASRGSPQRVYAVTAEGRRTVGSDVMRAT